MKYSLKYPLYDFQVEGVEKSVRMKRLINGDDMGLGKTIQAIATVITSGAFPCLVICPASLKLNWQDEWHKWSDKKAVILNNTNQYTWHYFADPRIGIFGNSSMAHVFIVNYESLKKFFVTDIQKRRREPLKLSDIRFDSRINIFRGVIIDEFHRAKDPATLQAKLCKGIAHGKEVVMGLTGTPVVNRQEDLLSQLGILGRLNDFGGATAFKNLYCSDNSNLSDLREKLQSLCYFRREKKEVLKDLPDKVRHIVKCEITDEQKEEYNAAIDDLANYLREYKNATDPEIARSMRGEAMVRIGILKNISARGKIHLVVDYVRDVVETGEKIIVFVHLKEIAQALKKAIPKAVTILGEDDYRTRDRNVKRFQGDESVKVIICSIKAAGVGLTLTAATNVLFVELPWHHADTDQAEDRSYRNGQKNSVQCVYFLGRGTIDNYIYDIIQRKRIIASEVTGAKNYTEESVAGDIMEFMYQQIRQGKLNSLKLK